MAAVSSTLLASDLQVRQQLRRLAPSILLRTILIVLLSEFAVMLILDWLALDWGVGTAILDAILLTLLIAGPLYLYVFRPTAQLAGQAAAAPALSALRQSEQRYCTLAETAQDAIFLINRSGELEYVNTYAAQQFGVPPEQLAGKRPEEIFPHDFGAQQRDNLRGIFATGIPLHEEQELTFPQGKLWMYTCLVPVKNEAGEVTAVVGISRDITDRKQAEEELRQSAERFRQLLEALPVATRVIQGNRVVYSNTADALLFGYEQPQEVIGTDAFASIAATDVARLRDYAARRAAGEPAPTCFEAQAKRRDGNVFPVEISVTRVIHDGEPATLAVLNDLTEHKRLLLYESLLPVCSVCGKVRDDTGTERGQGQWRSWQEYMLERSSTSFSHGFCPECYRKYRRQAGLPEEPPSRHK